MKNLTKALALLLMLSIVLGCVPLLPSTQAQAAGYYTDYTHVATISNYSGCTGMQGMAIDDTYIYCVKIASSTQDNAIITRTHKDTGDTVYLVNGATGGYFFTELYHANDMELVTIDGVKNLFVATSLAGSTSLVRYTLSGTTLTRVGSYDTIYNGASTAVSSAQVMSVSSDEIRFMIKKGKHLYHATLDPAVTSGQITMTHAFTLDVANVTFNGVVYDLSEYLHQGFDYQDGRIFVPITGYPDMSISTIAVFDTQGVSGTIRNDPTLSFYIQSSTYSVKFEMESCEVSPSDGRLYFNTNQENSSSGNYDAIHYITGYTYDPSHWTDSVDPYRWELSGDTLVSDTTAGAVYNGLDLQAGSISDGQYTGVRYALHQSVTLKHDAPWILEWKSSGSWTDGGLLLSSYSKSKFEGNTFIFRRKNSTLIAIGQYTGGTFYNYGLQLSDYGIDGTAEHVYRMTNKIADDGSNMVWLSVDGTELGPLNGYHIAGTSQGTTDDWLSGQDFTFSYIGTDQHPIDDCSLQYLRVWPQGLLDMRDAPDTFCWEGGMTAASGTGLTANTAAALSGSVSGTTYTDSRYDLTQDVVLLHDRPWSVEWQSEGTFGGALLLSSAGASMAQDAPFLFRNSASGVIALGYHDGTQFNNYGIKLSDHGIDGTASHTYRLTNRISADGSNMVYLYVDDVELGAMDNYHIGGTAQGTTSDWVAGKDFTFSYIGTVQHDLNATISYLKVWENGIPADHAPARYRWETQNDSLTDLTDGFTANDAAQLAGSCTDGVYSGSYFQLEKSVVLRHDLPWSIQWASEGTWKDAASGSLLLCASTNGTQIHSPYLYRRNDSQIIAFGERLDGYHQNYGIKLSDHGIDGTAWHSYRLENRIAADGSNMVYLYVDDVELGAMENYYKGGTAQGTTSDWISGKDFVFSYVGNPDFPMGSTTLDYLQIQEGCSHTYESITTAPTCTAAGSVTYTCTGCGDTYTETTPAAGHDYEALVTAPTCTAGGYTTYTCAVCSDTYTADETPKAAHSYEALVTAPTCTAGGYTTYTCAVCSDTYTADETPAAGHDYEAVVTAPTCTAGGYTTYTCAACSDTYTADHTAMTSHSYADGSCTVCGAACTHSWSDSKCTVCNMAYPTRDYYLFGNINGADYGCEEDASSLGEYKFVDGKLTAIFRTNSYVAIKSGDNADWYMAYTYPGDQVTAGTLFNTRTGSTEKLFVPGGKQITFTLVHNGDDSFTLSYVMKDCPHSSHDTAGICTACGQTTEHTYSGGSCTICGVADPNAVTDPGLTLSYPSLSFEDEIFYNVYFTVGDMTSVEELGLMLLSSRQTDATIDDAIGTVPGYVTNGTMYMVRSEGVAAAYMGDTIYFKIYAKLTDGTYAYSTAGGYNAKAYASTVLGGDYTSEMKSLVVAMVNYGAEAQLYFEHNTDKLVNANLTDEQKALIGSYDESMVDAVVPADSSKTTDFVRVSSNFKSLYPSVSFDSAFSINFYCTPAITVDDGMTLYYWDAETYNSISKFSVDNATGSMEMTESNGQYWGNVPGIAAKDMDKTYYVTCVFESNGETITTGIIPYSLGKYCEGKAATDGDAQQAFAQATAVYGYYAKQYFASIA